MEWNAPSASIAYNRLLDQSDAEYLVLVHQDVFLPAGWMTRLRGAIAALSRLDPDWAVLGAHGVALDGRAVGPVWSSSLGSIVGRVSLQPVAVQSLDELLIVVRRSAVRFDTSLPGFHFHGTDIVQIAAAAGRSSYVTSLPLVHNDRFKGVLGDDFRQAYHYIRTKWRQQLPLCSPVVKVSWHGLHLLKSQRHLARSHAVREAMVTSDTVDPRVYASLCGWDDVTPGPFSP
ncbi:hypothetical protein VW29_06140 [Devosia limi DSM 17137]|uniref:Glycosyltransferase like family protein n=1 Tax=Devosia limi DSM 17137 TaxID=1121477 RepID=A0A0F5LTN3_9HYPH|nr:hypothetical protein VW29_06140 [Devosia limi DSM 17137]